MLSQSKVKQQKSEHREIEDHEDDDEEEQQRLQERQIEELRKAKEAIQNQERAKAKKKHDINRDGPATELSNDILSYERFYPGRVLGNTFTITNKTEETIIIHMNFTREWLSTEYIAHKLQEFQEVATVDEIEKPYWNYLKQDIVDAEKLFECWFIEDPYSKTLVKQVRYELQPHDSFEFIIVLKSPIIKKTYFLTTNINVENVTHMERHKVFAFGSLDVPKLSCPKEIMDKDNNYAWVRIVMRKKMPIQIFKLLLINRGDMAININFSSLENDEKWIFTIKNPVMVIDPNMRSLLEIKAIHKYKGEPDEGWKPTNNLKLIIGKIKDCELKFSLIVDVVVIN